MKKLSLAAIFGLIILLLIGCAPVKFYSNSGLTENTGLKYYTVNPFLQVEMERTWHLCYGLLKRNMP